MLEGTCAVIEDHPGEFTKTRLAVMIGGRKQSALKAIDRLVDLGHVETTTGARGNVYRCVRPFRQQERDQFPGQFPAPVPGCGNLKDGTGEPVPSGNHWEPLGTTGNHREPMCLNKLLLPVRITTTNCRIGPGTAARTSMPE